MISPDDTMAASLWYAHPEYTNTSCLKSKQTALPLRTHSASSAEAPSCGDDNSNGTSELPYLCTGLAETKPADYTSLSTVDSLGSDIDNALLIAMLSSDDTAVESYECSVHTRPILYINPIMGNMVLSAPSPVDSGYGSRPDTPAVEMYGGYGTDESTWSPVDDTSSISDDSSNTHMSEGFSDAKYWHHVTDAKATSPAPQGPVIPRIVLSDEEGRVVEATIDDQFGVFSQLESPTADEADSPYGGLMSLTALENIEPASPVSCVSPAAKLRNSAAGAVLDRAFVSLIRPRTTPLVTTSIYHSCHRAPTFVLECVGEEEEEEQREEVEEECVRIGAAGPFFVLEEQDEECMEQVVDVEEIMNPVEASGVEVPSEDVECPVRCLTGKGSNAVQDSMNFNGTESMPLDVQSAGSSAPTLVSNNKGEFNTWYFEDGEDDECEECGLFLTEPDDSYHKFSGNLDRLPCEPTIVFGLLKLVTRAPPTNELNTMYHVTMQGRTFRTKSAPCLYDCERGYWNNAGVLSSIIYPQDCPVHGGSDACEVDAIFHHSTVPLLSSTEPDCRTPDYQVLASEVVGLAPLETKLAEEDLDDSDLVLHRGEKFRPVENRSAAPKAGSSYDDYMSRFMDDVDLPNSSSNDSSRSAPFGKFVGGTLRDMTMPEAVDHLKEGLEKTENAFRAALTAPFRFNSVADKLAQHLKSDSKALPPKERRGSNAFRHHRKESSVSGIKTKWSNMLNKFTR